MIPETSPLPHYRKPLDSSAADPEAASTCWMGLNSTIIMWLWSISSGRWKPPHCPPECCCSCCTTNCCWKQRLSPWRFLPLTRQIIEHPMALAVSLVVKMGVGQNLIDAK